MNKLGVKCIRTAVMCIFITVLSSAVLQGQTPLPTPTPTPTPPPTTGLDGGVPETSVTDCTTIISTDVDGNETSAPDTTTLAAGSPALSPTSLSTGTATLNSTTTSNTASAPTRNASTTTSCSIAGPADPGARPVGNQNFTVTGSTAAGTNRSLLTVGVKDFFQPPDANGNEGAGNVLNNAGNSTGFWFDALAVFSQLASVDGAADPATHNPTIKGLGPAFNANGCFTCHSQPTIGGTSPPKNPQIAVAHAFGATNAENLSSFVRPTGPIREARFIFDQNDTSFNNLDGGVHELFTIAGRSDASPNCQLLQPDFNGQIHNHNVIFRIPIPTFGEGLVENVTDNDLANNLNNFANDKASFHVAGRFNRNGNDGTITRFGWKAQNKSMLLFAGEAANVEMGVTNEIFQNEKVPGLSCALNPTSEDNTHVPAIAGPGADPSSTASLVSSAIENFALFMRLNGAPSQCAFNSGVDANGAARCIALNDTSTSAQAAASAKIARGKLLFGAPSNGGMGCILCHSETLTTGPSDIVGLSNRLFTPFSDFALHHMGATLADGINQGLAGADEFRTAPLWGTGQRLFFMHDGRATGQNALVQAIEAHFSDPNVCFNTSSSEGFTVNGHRFLPGTSAQSCGSEANESVRQFNALCKADKDAVLAFLRSL